MANYLFTDREFTSTGLKVCAIDPASIVHDEADAIGGGNAYPKENDVLIIDIFLKFKDPEYQHYQGLGGIALLKFLRIMGSETSRKHRNHIVLLSPWSLVELLRMSPGYHVLASPGITIAQYTYSLDELKGHDGVKLDLKELAKEKAPPRQELREWFKAGISLPKDERHNWAQWWGAECMRRMHNKAYPKDEIPQPESISAKLKELKCAELKVVYPWPENFDAPAMREQYLPEGKNVLYVDDNCDIGWKDVLASFTFGTVTAPKQRGQGVFENGGLVSMKPIGAEVEEVFYERVLTELKKTRTKQWGQEEDLYAFVLLDVRLFAEPHDTPDTKLSGIELLRRIRAAYPTLPVVLLTATARADFFKAFEKIGLVEHWTKPSPEDSGKKDHISRSYLRLRRLLMNVGRLTQDSLGLKFAATTNAIDQLGRVIGYAPTSKKVFVNDKVAFDKIVKVCDGEWMQATHVTVDTNFLLADGIHEVLPVLYFISLARLGQGKKPVAVINHVFDELTLHQERAAKGWCSRRRSIHIQRALGRKASFVLPFITTWMADKRILHYIYAHEAHHQTAGTITNDSRSVAVCNSHGKYIRGGGIVADDIFVCEFVQELKQKRTCRVVLFSNEVDTDAQKLPHRMKRDLTVDEEQRFSYVRIDALKPMARALEQQLSNLSY